MSKEKKPVFCEYVSTKIDSDVLPSAKAAAAIAKQSVMDWLSDVANAAAAEQLGHEPIERKPNRPKP